MKKETRINFDKKCRLDKVCGSDEIRVEMNNVFFKDGYAYATDSHIIVRANLKSISNLPQETIDALNGHCISKECFADLQKAETFEILEDGTIQSYALDKTTNTIYEDCAFNFADESAIMCNGKYWGDSLIETFDNFYSMPQKSINRFAFNPKDMEQLFQAIGYKGAFIFTSIENGGGGLLFVVNLAHSQSIDNDVAAIFSPIILSDDVAAYINKLREKIPESK